MEQDVVAHDPELVDNPSERCACVLLLDTSSSMRGQPIQALNEALNWFKSELDGDPIARRRVDVAVVTFDSDVRVEREFVSVAQFQPPLLSAQGQTYMGGGIRKALQMIEDRKESYRAYGIPYYRPWIFMITDGEPQGEPEGLVMDAAARVREAEDKKHVAFFTVGVMGANMNRLNSIAPPQRPPLKLQGLKFEELFQWLSASLTIITKSGTGDEMIALPSAKGWSAG